MDRFADMFQALERRGEGAFVPFLVLGDGGPAVFPEIVRALIENGADALELGVPTEDPSLDGAAIKAAHRRAVDGATPTLSWRRSIKEIRAAHPRVPICVQAYAGSATVLGDEAFCRIVAGTGADALLVADAGEAQSAALRAGAAACDLKFVALCRANAGDANIANAARTSEGFVYVVSRPGRTGTGRPMAAPDPCLFTALGRHGAAPALVGFGVCEPAHVTAAVAAGAAGVVCGSAIAERIEAHLEQPKTLLAELASYVQTMKTAARA